MKIQAGLLSEKDTLLQLDFPSGTARRMMTS